LYQFDKEIFLLENKNMKTRYAISGGIFLGLTLYNGLSVTRSFTLYGFNSFDMFLGALSTALCLAACIYFFHLSSKQKK